MPLDRLSNPCFLNEPRTAADDVAFESAAREFFHHLEDL